MRSCCFPRSQLCQVSIPQPHSILPQCSSCSGTVFSRGGLRTWSRTQKRRPCLLPLSCWLVCPGMCCTSDMALEQLELFLKQQGSWRRDDVPRCTAPCSRLLAKLLHLIAVLCFSSVYPNSNDILPAVWFSVVVAVLQQPRWCLH